VTTVNPDRRLLPRDVAHGDAATSATLGCTTRRRARSRVEPRRKGPGSSSAVLRASSPARRNNFRTRTGRTPPTPPRGTARGSSVRDRAASIRVCRWVLLTPSSTRGAIVMQSRVLFRVWGRDWEWGVLRTPHSQSLPHVIHGGEVCVVIVPEVTGLHASLVTTGRAECADSSARRSDNSARVGRRATCNPADGRSRLIAPNGSRCESQTRVTRVTTGTCFGDKGVHRRAWHMA
jgi:hypothetical protein